MSPVIKIIFQLPSNNDVGSSLLWPVAAQSETSYCCRRDGAPGPLPESEIVVIVASGPFTATPGEDSPALERVLFIAAEKHASVVVLMGPFVDAEHAVIKEDQLGERYEDVQLRLMRSRLLTALKSMPETEVWSPVLSSSRCPPKDCVVLRLRPYYLSPPVTLLRSSSWFPAPGTHSQSLSSPSPPWRLPCSARTRSTAGRTRAFSRVVGRVPPAALP